MDCPGKSNACNSQQVGLASMKADMHGLIETVPTSGNSPAPVNFQKRGVPCFPGIVTVSVTIFIILSYFDRHWDQSLS